MHSLRLACGLCSTDETSNSVPFTCSVGHIEGIASDVGVVQCFLAYDTLSTGGLIDGMAVRQVTMCCKRQP